METWWNILIVAASCVLCAVEFCVWPWCVFVVSLVYLAFLSPFDASKGVRVNISLQVMIGGKKCTSTFKMYVFPPCINSEKKNFDTEGTVRTATSGRQQGCLKSLVASVLKVFLLFLRRRGYARESR